QLRLLRRLPHSLERPSSRRRPGIGHQPGVEHHRGGEVGALIAIALLAAGPRQHLGPPVPDPVRRVVTVAPALSEIVLALGAGERLAGVTRFDDDPRERDLPRIGGYNDPQPEAVLAVKPDLILAEPAPENRGPVETLARLGIAVATFPLSTVAHIEAAISAIAGFLGVPERGLALNAHLERARQQARKAAAGRKRVRALLVFGLDPLVVAGPGGFAGELLADAGGENAAGDNPLPFFRLSAEAAVLFRLRVPRVVLAAEVGAALSVAGVALQALLRNPLADPFVFGLSGGAAIGTALVTVASGTALGVAAGSAASFVGVLPAQLAAVAGAMAAALLVFTLGRARGQLEPARALLGGVVFNSFASALVLSVEAVLRPDQMQAVSLW